MMGYLDRLKDMNSEKRLPSPLPKLPKVAFGSYDSSQGGRFQEIAPPDPGTPAPARACSTCAHVCRSGCCGEPVAAGLSDQPAQDAAISPISPFSTPGTEKALRTVSTWWQWSPEDLATWRTWADQNPDEARAWLWHEARKTEHYVHNLRCASVTDFIGGDDFDDPR